MESPSASSISRGEEDEDVLLDHEHFLDPLEERVFTAAQDLMDEIPEEQVITKLNIIAETLEDAENSFRKDRSPPYRREGHLIGNLLRLLGQFKDFFPMLERKLSIVTPNRVKAAACRVLLATVPANSRFIVRILYEEEILDNICEWSCGSEAALRCYSTGLLSIGLRDRSIADIAVNKDTPITFLKRARLYASKLEKERQLAVKYMQDRARNSTSKQKKVSVSADATGKSTFRTNTSVVIGLKRKVSGGTEKFSVEADVSSMEETFVNTGESINSQILRQEDGQFSDVPEDISTLPDPNCHEEDLKKLVMLELLYTLDCIGSLGEYLELFAPALKEDIVGTIITFLHSKNPTVLAHSIKLTSHFLAHKKFALSMIDAGGVELILASYHLTSTVVGSQLHRSISMCLHGFASSSAVMEKILYLDGETLLSVAFGLLSSPNDRARQNAVVFLGLTIPFKVVMDYFEKQNGLYILLNIIRAGNNPRSSAQRQLSHDACLCLRQYLRVQVALVAHRLRRKLSQLHYHPFSSSTPLPAVPGGRKSCLSARVPKLSALKPVDIDDKAHEQNLIFFEKYRFSAGSFCTGHEIWSPAVRLSHLRGILIMLEVVAMGCTVVHEGNPEDASSTIRLWLVERAHFCLESLRMLTLVATSLAPEVCATEVSYSFRENDDEAEEVDHVSPGKKKVGVSLLLEIATSSNAKDADLIREALHVLCNCVSPPHGEECWQHPYKDLRQFTLTARSQRRYTPSVENLSDHVLPQSQQGNGNMSGEKFASVVSAGNFVCCAKAKDDKALRPLRKLAREKNAIKVCVQLLRYKRSVQNADAIRLLATRVLLGLSRDRQIAQILEKMQIGQLLSDLIRQEPVLEENADLHVRFRECAMDLISLVTHRAPSAVINEAADPTVRKIEKASIVAQTKINYDSQELLRIIHEHLLSRGLDKAADVLAKEADLVDHNPKTQFSSSVEYIHSPSAAKVTRILLPSSDISSVMHPEGEPRAPKIRRLHLSADSETKSPRGPSPQTLTPSSQLEITVPLAYSLRKKQIKKAMMSPHLFQRNDIQQAETMVQRQLARSKSICSSAQLSKLDEIICHYLREQHRHCVNPVTTVPPFKLSSAASFHRCPDPPSTSSLNVNIFKRLATRSFIRNAAHWSFSAVSSDIINRYVFSRYRPFRVVGSHGASYWGGMCSSEFLGVNQLLTGNYNGEIRLWNLDSDSVVEEWSCHEGSLPIVDLQANVHTRLGTQSSLFISGTAGYMPYEHSEIALWDLKNMSSSRWRFDGRSARFNTYGDRVVALDIRMHVNEDWEDRSDSVRSNVNGAVLLDVATGEVLAELKDNTFTNGYGAETNCIFAHCDTIVLSDGVLWDVRMSSIRAIHKFDKLSNSGFGHFHPNGNEVLVNSAVWDLRTYRLLRMVPSLDKCNLMFNTTGNAIYAYHAYGAGGLYLAHRKSRLKSWFRVLDAHDYRDVATVELERPIYNLSIDPKSLRLSVVEGRYADSQEDDDPICRLYEIGRKRPSEDDSDIEDAHDDSDTLDDDEFDDESGESSDEDEDDIEDDGDDESESEPSASDEEGDFESDESVNDEDGVIDEIEEDSDVDENEDLTRGIRFLLEIPDGAYYDMHGQYSSDEEDVNEE